MARPPPVPRIPVLNLSTWSPQGVSTRQSKSGYRDIWDAEFGRCSSYSTDFRSTIVNVRISSTVLSCMSISHVRSLSLVSATSLLPHTSISAGSTSKNSRAGVLATQQSMVRKLVLIVPKHTWSRNFIPALFSPGIVSMLG